MFIKCELNTISTLSSGPTTASCISNVSKMPSLQAAVTRCWKDDLVQGLELILTTQTAGMTSRPERVSGFASWSV